MLAKKQLAACLNLLSIVESIFRWQGNIDSSAGTLAIFKTSAAAYPDFERELGKLHPYNVLEIIAIEPTAVTGTYAEWLLAETSSSGQAESVSQTMPKKEP